LTTLENPQQSTSCVTPDGIIRNPQADHETLPEGPWDGRRYAYIPRIPLPVHPNARLHDEFERDVDPITYQVLRSRFWHMNLEHADVLMRVSGSMVIVYSLDFATCLCAENGDIVTTSPTIQYFSGVAEGIIKWTLEHRGEDIRDGDIFVQNDPFIGAAHQSDVAIYAPVFWDGKIFCWVYNCSHIGDLGGVDPGGWAINARDVWDEGVTIPPMKIVRDGELASDLVDTIARQSRDPRMIVLGVKASVAGVEATRKKMVETLQQYGPEVVKGAMRKMIADTSRVFSERLQRIPDGTWSERLYLCGITNGPRISHQEVLTLTKRGDSLICTNAGTAPQAGPGNTPFSVLRSCVLAALSTMLTPDQLGCVAGIANHVRFEPVPGTRNCATHPAAVSAIVSAFQSANLAGLVTSKMVMSGPPSVRAHANGSGALAQPMGVISMGIDERGDYVGVDSGGAGGTALAGGLGAFPYRDGIDAGGSWWLLGTTAGNVEDIETAGVLLALYRRENPDSGGPGRWRGGNGASLAMTPHKVHMMISAAMYSDLGTNTSAGIGGGSSGLAGNLFRVPDLVPEMLRRGRVPRDRPDIEAAGLELVRLDPRALLAPVPKTDALIHEFNGGGGYGDPLEREPARVATDVAEERITPEAAERHWGVVVRPDGAVDEDATAARRTAIRAERLDGASAFGEGSRGPISDGVRVVVAGAAGSVDLVEVDGRLEWACSSCGEGFGPASENFKLAAAAKDERPHAVDADMYPDPAEFGDSEIVIRRFFCPSCASLVAQEFCRADAEPLFDFAIHALPEAEA